MNTRMATVLAFRRGHWWYVFMIEGFTDHLTRRVLSLMHHVYFVFSASCVRNITTIKI